MAFISAEKKEKNKATLKFSIDEKTFQDEVTKVFQKKAASITVPGFRRGKAPRSVVEKMYGKGAFYEDALNNLMPAAYNEALEASGLEVVGRPSVDVESIEGDVVLVAEVVTKPEVEIKDYIGIPVTRNAEKATDEEVTERIDAVRARNARTTIITDRAAADGDTVNIDFKGFCDGVPFEGGESDGYDLKLGSGAFIPGFEAQVVGHEVGEPFDVNVTFPKEYHAENLAGKDATFKVKINEIRYDELPALDDEFAKDVSEFDTLDEYKADIKAKIQSEKEKAADSAVEGQIIDALIGKLEADIPEEMYVAETENFVRDYDTQLRMQGMDLSTYFKYTGMDLPKLREQFRPQAERQVKTRLALEKIASLENVTVSEEETEEEYKKLAESYGVGVDECKKYIPAEDVNKDLAVKKAIDLVKAGAKVTKKAAAKKTAAKSTEEKAEEAKEAKPAKTTKSTAAKSTAAKSTAAKTTTKKAPAKKAEEKKDAE